MRLKNVWVVGLSVIVLCAAVLGAPAYSQVVYEYDEHGRLKSATYPDGSAIDYVLDDQDNRSELDVGENAPRAIDDDGVMAIAGEPIVLNVLDNDWPGFQDLNIVEILNPGPSAGGTAIIAIDGKSITYTPGAATTETFHYRVEDAALVSSTATVFATINTAPVATDDEFWLEPNDADVVIDVLANDVDADGDPISITQITSAPAVGSASISLGSRIIYDAPATIGDDPLTYETSDDRGGSDAGVLTVVVNGAPVANDVVVTAEYLAANVEVDVLGGANPATDPNGHALSVGVVTQPEIMGAQTGSTAEISSAGDKVNYSSDPNWAINGYETFTYQATDSHLLSNVATVTVNHPPIISDMPWTRVAGDARKCRDADPWIADPNGASTREIVSVDATTTAGGAAEEHEDNETLGLDKLCYTPPATGTTDSFTYTVQDEHGASTVGNVVIALLPPSLPPLVSGEDLEFDIGPIFVDVMGNDTDPDGDSISLSTVNGGGASGLSFTIHDASAGIIKISGVSPNVGGPYSIGYSVTDGSFYTPGTMAVTVLEDGASINSAPEAQNDSLAYNVSPQTTLTLDVLANDSDPESNALTITAADTSNAGVSPTIVQSGTRISYTTVSGVPSDYFYYTITDSSGGVSKATVWITLNGEPAANDDSYSSFEGGASSVLDVLANDSDPENDPLSIMSVTVPSNGGVAAIVNNESEISYTPGTAGMETFTYSIADGQGNITTANVNIDVNGAPDAVNDDPSVTTADTVTLSLLANDTDPNSDPLTITNVTTPTRGGLATIDAGSTSVTYQAGSAGTETFDYTVSDGRGGVDSATAFIDVTPTPTISVADASAAEGDSVDFVVSLSNSSSLSVAADYATTNGTADGSDYTAATSTITFAPGEVSKTVAVASIEDVVHESDETFSLTLSNLSNADAGDLTADATISNDDAAPAFSIDDATIGEGGTLAFTVTKNGASAFSHDVDFATADDSATSADYTTASGTLTFSAGETTKPISVATLQDSIFEGDETLVVDLSAATAGATISDAQGTGTIDEDDAPPAFSINDVSVAEGGALVFTVTKTGTTTASHSVNFATSNGSAQAADYTANSGVLTFAAAETTKTVSVSTTEDSTYEIAQTVNLDLSNATNGATISDSQGVGTINNDDAAPTFSVNGAGSVNEGGVLTYPIVLSAASEIQHTVDFSTSNGSAESNDYTANSGSKTFAAGQTSKSVTVSTVEDGVHETNETVKLDLTLPAGGGANAATIADAQANGTIVDDDAAPSFSINNVSNGESGNLTFTITKSGTTERTHKVDYATANGSATAADYTSKSGNASFPSATTTKTVTVTVTNDSGAEPNETVLLNLSSPTNNATISDSQGVGTIQDDDPTAVNDTATTSRADVILIPVLTNDSDPNNDPLTITNVVKFGQGFWSISGNKLQYSAPYATGTWYADYTISDGNGGTDVGRATVTVVAGGGGGEPGP